MPWIDAGLIVIGHAGSEHISIDITDRDGDGWLAGRLDVKVGPWSGRSPASFREASFVVSPMKLSNCTGIWLDLRGCCRSSLAWNLHSRATERVTSPSKAGPGTCPGVKPMSRSCWSSIRRRYQASLAPSELRTQRDGRQRNIASPAWPVKLSPTAGTRLAG
jgi:hypothetical protein